MALEHLAEYPPWLRMGILRAATNLALSRGEHKQALAFSEQARAILPQVGDPDVVCNVMMFDGLLAGQRGDLDHARAAIEDALRFARDHSLPTLSNALIDLGDIAIEQGRLDEGRALLEEAIACSHPTSSEPVVALINLSEIAALQGRYRDAASVGRTGLAIALEAGDQLSAVSATSHIAWGLAELASLSAPDGSSEPQRRSSKMPASQEADRTCSVRNPSSMRCTGDCQPTRSTHCSSKAA